jgi:hypothetical protein
MLISINLKNHSHDYLSRGYLIQDRILFAITGEKMRQHLQEITDKENTSNEEKVRQINNLPLEIKGFLDLRRDDDLINCHAHTLGLGESRIYLNFARKYQASCFLADSDFVQALLDQGLLPRTVSPEPGGVVIYLDNRGVIMHSGRIIDSSGKINSKWGGVGIFEHGLLDVPISYGKPILYCQPLDILTMENHFFNYFN